MLHAYQSASGGHIIAHNLVGARAAAAAHADAPGVNELIPRVREVVDHVRPLMDHPVHDVAQREVLPRVLANLQQVRFDAFLLVAHESSLLSINQSIIPISLFNQ
jgi:hypothetical protein